MNMILRVWFLVGALALAAGCSDRSVIQHPASSSEAKAVAAARAWMAAEQQDPVAANYEVRPDRDGRWRVIIQRIPAMPGGHAALVLDANFAVVEVWPGA
jgi:hypothetical protein